MYIMTPSVSCLELLREAVFLACNLACAKTGKRIAARIAMIAMTTRSSMRVKPRCFIILMAPCIYGRGGVSNIETTRDDEVRRLNRAIADDLRKQVNGKPPNLGERLKNGCEPRTQLIAIGSRIKAND